MCMLWKATPPSETWEKWKGVKVSMEWQTRKCWRWPGGPTHSAPMLNTHSEWQQQECWKTFVSPAAGKTTMAGKTAQHLCAALFWCVQNLSSADFLVAHMCSRLPGGCWTSDKKFPACTLFQALMHFLDVTTPPSQQLLLTLSQLTKEESERKRLQLLGHVSWGELGREDTILKTDGWIGEASDTCLYFFSFANTANAVYPRLAAGDGERKMPSHYKPHIAGFFCHLKERRFPLLLSMDLYHIFILSFPQGT